MEVVILLLLIGAVLVFVGAIQGLRAMQRVGELQRQVDELMRELHALRRELRRDADAKGPATQAEPEPPPPQAAMAAWPQPKPTAAAPGPVAAPAAAPEPRPAPRSPQAPPPLPIPQPQPAAVEPARELPPPLPAAAARAESPAPAPAAARAEPILAPTAPPVPQPAAFEGVEQALGLRWLVWIGLGMLFLGVAFFLKYAYDRDWLGRFFGPHLRIATAAAAAATLLVWGWRSLKNGMAAFGQGLLGGGQALLYLTIYAAFQPAAMVVDEPLFGPTVAFALMAMVTAAGLAAAVRLDAIAMAFLAVLGGFATPALIHTGQDARDLLCAYLLVLDLGVLAVASYRQWRALDLLAFAGTAVLFTGWWNAFGHAHPQPDATLLWVAVFHAVFAVLPIVQHWRQRTPVAIERFGLALANLAVALAFLTHTLHAAAPKLLALLCLGGAALYTGLGFVTAHRVGDDRRTRDGFLALATMLLTLGLFFLLPGGAIGAAWYAEAVVLLWFGLRFVHPPTRVWATAVLGAALLRTLVHDVPGIDLFARFPRGPIDEALPFLWNPWYTDLLLAVLGLAGFGFLHRRQAIGDVDGNGNGSRGLASGFGIAAGMSFLGATTAEILCDAMRHPDAWQTLRPPVAIALWNVFGAVAFVAWARRWPSRATFFAAFAPGFAALAATAAAYTTYPADAWPMWNGACLAGQAAVAAFALAGVLAERCGAPAATRPGLLGFVQLALGALATVETVCHVQRGLVPPPQGTLAQALGWVWLALGGGGALLAVGWRSRRVLALASLPLALAALVPVRLAGMRLDPHVWIGNQRFLFGLLVTAVIAALRPPLQRLATRALADAAAATAFALLLVYAVMECITWSIDTCVGKQVVAWAIWMTGFTAVGGTAGGAVRARATGNPALRLLALIVLAPALALPLLVYGTGFETDWMFANLRFLLVGAGVASGALWGRIDPRVPATRWCALATALLGLTLEPPAWFLANVADAAEAARLAKFSVTVTWVVTAVVMLAWGFRRDRRPLRLLALGLFVLTGAKLLAFDMSGAQQLYRILAFVLVGLTFVGASWLYHRAEKRLAASRADRTEPAQGEHGA